MKKRRVGIRKTKQRSHLFLSFLFLVLLPAMAIYIGLRITEKWVAPTLSSEMLGEEESIRYEDIKENSENSENSEKPEEASQGEDVAVGGEEEVKAVEISPLSVYAIQIASVTDMSNIEKFAHELEEKELSYLIYRRDNSFKVYTLGLTERKYVEAQLERIRGFYPDAYIVDIHLPTKKIQYKASEGERVEGLAEGLNHLIELVQAQGEEWNKYFQKEGNLQQYKELLTQHEKALTSLKEKAGDNSLPEGLPSKDSLEKSIHYQENNIKKALELVDQEGKVYAMHSLYLDSLFRVMDLTK